MKSIDVDREVRRLSRLAVILAIADLDIRSPHECLLIEEHLSACQAMDAM